MKGCRAQTTQKYMKRDSPAYPANQCCGKVKVGKTGAMYKSVPNRTGVCRWIKTGKRGRLSRSRREVLFTDSMREMLRRQPLPP